MTQDPWKKMTPEEYKAMTPEQRREQWTHALAKVLCVIAGMHPIDPMDSSPNYWVFIKDAETMYDNIMTRFPYLPKPDK